MKIKCRTVFGTALLVVGLLPTATWATDFYASSIHPNRSDNHSGTSSSAPWATWDKIKASWGSTIQAGDTVHLERGSSWNWTGNTFWLITTGGNASSGPITITGADYGSGAKPALLHTGGSQDDHTFHISGSASYITLRDFLIDGGSQLGFGASGIRVAHQPQTGNISHVDIINMTIQNIGGGAWKYNCGIYYSAHNGYSVSDCLIESNDVSGFGAQGLNHYPQKSVVPNQSSMNRLTWRNNRVHSPASVRYSSSAASGIHIAMGGTDNLFEYNYVDGTHEETSIGIDNVANSENNLVVRHNVVNGNTDSFGIRVKPDYNGAQGVTLDAAIYGNLVVGCAQAGIAFQSENLYGGTVNVYNNTLYNNNSRPDMTYSGEVWINSKNNTLDVVLRNNILYHTSTIGAVLNVSGSYLGTLTHDHNLYYHPNAGFEAIKVGGSTYTVPNVNSFEPTALHVDPLFVNTALPPTGITSENGTNTDGFTLQPGSTALDSGVNLGTSYSSSLDGMVRPASPTAWDRGSYQVQEDIPNPPTSLTVLP